MISWRDAFPSGSLMWLLLASMIAPTLVTIGYVLLLTRTRAAAEKMTTGLFIGIPVIASELLLCWGLWIYSLAFAPSWGTVPELVPGEIRPMISLQEMMAIEDAKPDESNTHGRGGIVGDGKFFQFEFVFPTAGAEGPHFSVKRPHYHVPHILEFFMRWSGAWMVLFPLWLVWRQQMSVERAGVLTILWATIVYPPVAHAVWGDGWLEHLGTVDVGGGIVLIAMSAAVLVTARKTASEATTDELTAPRLTAGALLLLAGYSLYFAAMMFRADPRAALSILNTLLGAGATIVVWNLSNRFVWKRQSPTGAELAVVTGLAAMASASAAVLPQSAMIIGGFTGLLSSFCWNMRRNHVDDDFTPLKFIGLGAALGMLATGVFATSASAANRWDGRPVTGLLEGNANQVLWQLAGVGASLAWSLVMSWILYRVVTFRSPVTAPAPESPVSPASA